MSHWPTIDLARYPQLRTTRLHLINDVSSPVWVPSDAVTERHGWSSRGVREIYSSIVRVEINQRSRKFPNLKSVSSDFHETIPIHNQQLGSNPWAERNNPSTRVKRGGGLVLENDPVFHRVCSANKSYFYPQFALFRPIQCLAAVENLTKPHHLCNTRTSENVHGSRVVSTARSMAILQSYVDSA